MSFFSYLLHKTNEEVHYESFLKVRNCEYCFCKMRQGYYKLKDVSRTERNLSFLLENPAASDESPSLERCDGLWKIASV